MAQITIPGSGSTAEASQNEKVRSHLESGKSITALEAFKRYNIMRLSGRIYDLSHNDGMPIKREMVNVGKKRVARYSLETMVV